MINIKTKVFPAWISWTHHIFVYSPNKASQSSSLCQSIATKYGMCALGYEKRIHSLAGKMKKCWSSKINIERRKKYSQHFFHDCLKAESRNHGSHWITLPIHKCGYMKTTSVIPIRLTLGHFANSKKHIAWTDRPNNHQKINAQPNVCWTTVIIYLSIEFFFTLIFSQLRWSFFIRSSPRCALLRTNISTERPDVFGWWRRRPVIVVFVVYDCCSQF